MSQVTIEPATLLDVVELAGGRGWLVWRVLRKMWMEGKSWAFRRDGELVAVAGLFPLPANAADAYRAVAPDIAATLEGGEDMAEAWFEFSRKAPPALLGIARLTRLTLAAQTYRRIICLCTSSEGARFAALTGFRREGAYQPGELWER